MPLVLALVVLVAAVLLAMEQGALVLLDLLLLAVALMAVPAARVVLALVLVVLVVVAVCVCVQCHGVEEAFTTRTHVHSHARPLLVRILRGFSITSPSAACQGGGAGARVARVWRGRHGQRQRWRR